MISHRLSAILAALTLLTIHNCAHAAQNQLAPELNGYFTMGDRIRLFLLADLARSPLYVSSGDAPTAEELELGVHLDVNLKPALRPNLLSRVPGWEKDRLLWMRVGYNYVTTLHRDPGAGRENRTLIEVTARQPVGSPNWLVLRGRVDFRDKDGAEFTRHRVRLGWETEARLFGRDAAPYLNAEILHDSRYGHWNERRYQVGAEFLLNKQWRYELYYMLINNQDSEQHNTNVVGIVLRYNYEAESEKEDSERHG